MATGGMSHSASLDTLTNLAIDDPEDSVEPGEESLGIWGAADTGDVDRVQRLLESWGMVFLTW